MTTRRTFLHSTSLLCVCVAALPRLVAQSSSRQSSLFSAQNLFLYTHDLMTESALRRQIGSTFTVTLPSGGQSSIRLMDVVSSQSDGFGSGSAAGMFQTSAGLSQTAGGAGQAPAAQRVAGVGAKAVMTKGFRLAFAVEGPYFPQGSYALDHGVTGAAVMFLVPGDGTGVMKSCTAVFTSM